MKNEHTFYLVERISYNDHLSINKLLANELRQEIEGRSSNRRIESGTRRNLPQTLEETDT